MEKPFSYSVYQLGKRYVNKISDYSVQGNTITANVTDTKNYSIRLLFNQKKQLTGKTCTCNEAIIHGECKHMAAVFMKTMNENHLNEHKKSIRDLYIVYLQGKAKPKENDYFVFERNVRELCTECMHSKDLNQLISYASEFSKISYPSNRLINILNNFYEMFDFFYREKNTKDSIMNWIMDNLISNKLTVFHQYFFEKINQLPNEECLSKCDELLQHMTVTLNQELCSKVLMMIYDKSSLSLTEFMKKYSYLDNQEIFTYLQCLNCLNNHNYEQIIKILTPYHKKQKLTGELKKIYNQAVIKNNPLQYIQNKINQVSRWDLDFRFVQKLRNEFEQEWTYYRYPIYVMLKDKIDVYLLNRCLYYFNEWEVALFLLYQEMDEDSLYEFSDLIEKNNQQAYYEIILTYTLQLAKRGKEKDNQKIINILLDILYDHEDIYDYMAYYLVKNNPDNQQLIELLDKEKEDKHAYI